ncbi:hypothetical protein RQM65_06160 [Pricia sp. S334]|uniref:Uncharacterized protein n=1 Tax=Pricia mediterranea TaxID=3076079 RepID=A0ABU3L4I9_9FLAO|nr:hypothetical protein [Pricia sp. S334]MDT7828241.1 hypothetical protein [Pricia sp. S334]
MADAAEHNVNVLSPVDPHVPEFLDFKKLRREGLEHIGELAGKMWTDHNVHDPGITILETLVYALMDLGYRTNLPFEDLITTDSGAATDDNFPTPLQVLTVNPVTITDYRKLLLEVGGVRNAWLEPADQEVPLFIDGRRNQLDCKSAQYSDNQRCMRDLKYPFMDVRLNGLYKVYIEKDTERVRSQTDHGNLVREVRRILMAHRNLCEDFREEICLLQPLDIGICAEVEIANGFLPEKVYAQLIAALREFVQPRVRYYTLKELLEKGRPIDEIFAGRPYRKHSYGFVDTDEFEALERRKELRLSDLYTVLLGVEGVLRVKNIHINGGTPLPAPEFCPKEDGETGPWATGIRISDDQVPVFSLETTCVDVYGEQGYIALDKPKVHKSFSFPKKFHLPENKLDAQIPSGRYRDDLGAYRSIQHDFPVVYGIGDDGLPERASLLRKTQALQLKGYLLFYDQMLANYAAQLTRIRSLFALTPESDRPSTDRHTYFTQLAETVPGLEDLLQSYEADAKMDAGARLALAVARDDKWHMALTALDASPRPSLTVSGYCDDDRAPLGILTFGSAAVRAIYIDQMVESFSGDRYEVEVLIDRGGHFFVLYPSLPGDVALVGPKRFASFGEAYNDAKSTAFLCGLRESYNPVSDLSNPGGSDVHYFNLNYDPLSYMDLLQGLTENGTEYEGRRKRFLDHLLARFGEQFTDYTLLQYQYRMGDTDLDRRTIDDQSDYLHQVADLGRNRARAFNYGEASWNTDNVSGFEKRTSLLAGLENYRRRNLCNFEVSQCFRIQLRGPGENVFFHGNRSYDTKEELYRAAERVLVDLRHPATYDRLEKELNGFNRTTIHRLFSVRTAQENITVARYRYHQQILNAEDEVIVFDKGSSLASEKAAREKKGEFIRRINEGEVQVGSQGQQEEDGKNGLRKIDEGFQREEQTKEGGKGATDGGKTHERTKGQADAERGGAKRKGDSRLRLLPVDGDFYLDTAALDFQIGTLISYNWHIDVPGADRKKKGGQVFENEDEAWEKLIGQAEIRDYLTEHDDSWHWKLVIKGNIELRGAQYYPDRQRAVTAWRQAKTLGTEAAHYAFVETDGGSILELRNEKGGRVAVSGPLPDNGYDNEALIGECTQIFGNRNNAPHYKKSDKKYGFRILDGKSATILVSYSCFGSQRQALEQMGRVFTLGAQKKNYLRSGDEGNPEYRFLLRDDSDTFVAWPPGHLETASERDRALNTAVQFLKKNERPVYVKEEPRRYVWSVSDKGGPYLESDSEFPSKNKAQADFDRCIVERARKNGSKFLAPHRYRFYVLSVPSRFGFVYGGSDEQGRFDPLFKGKNTYPSHKEAAAGYRVFAEKLPALRLEPVTKKGRRFDFALFERDKKTPIAVQYRAGGEKASMDTARAAVGYIQDIYTQEGTPRVRFIEGEIAQHPEGKYEWRFYKKNAPIARSPYNCGTKEMAERIKFQICDVVPPIDLKECPPKKKVVCPEKNPHFYHYQVCFTAQGDREFRLISYRGYESYEEAEAAWEAQWLTVIDVARDPDNYGENGKISLEETYRDPDSAACDEVSFFAVVPEALTDRSADEGLPVIKYFVALAHLYPIVPIPDGQNGAGGTKYMYRVVLADAELIDTDCLIDPLAPTLGSLLWESTVCFGSSAEALEAYRHFYTLAGISNNCRVLCERGEYFVGLVEVLVESLCAYESEEEAWDEAFPNPEDKDACGDCLPRGVREFVYAAEDDKNYIVFCDRIYWKFKVVSPGYYVMDHARHYDSEAERDEQVGRWMEVLKKLDWDRYLPEKGPRAGENTYFPIHGTDEGYCIRLFVPAEGETITEEGLQPCGCDDVDKTTGTAEIIGFTGSRCYPCYEEAVKAFGDFRDRVLQGKLSPEPTERSPNGPYSFRLVDAGKLIGYHPQQYECAQDVFDAIADTKACVQQTGMHVLEHILMRPKSGDECGYQIPIGDNEFRFKSCLLPICPDYCCNIAWQPDRDRDDPCAEAKVGAGPDNGIGVDPDTIYYLPGSDPYSFWATVILPAWDRRFRTRDSRKAIEMLLYKEAPALVGLNILWLSPRDLCKFEEVFRKWLDWKQDPGAALCDPEGISPNCQLVDCIRELGSEPPCATRPGATGECECGPSEEESDDSCCLPPETEGSLFWGECQPDMPEGDVAQAFEDFSTGSELSGEPPAKTATSSTKKKNATERKNAVEGGEADPKPGASDGEEGEEVGAVPKPGASDGEAVERPEAGQTLDLVQKRNARYRVNAAEGADKATQRTKSYQRVQSFLKNPPTISEYGKLVSFFDRYSLHEGNNLSGFLELLKNATWHLLDMLLLKGKKLSKKDTKALKQSLQKLRAKGFSYEQLRMDWNLDEMQASANKEIKAQLEQLLN